MSIAALLTYATALFVAAIIPGPGIAALIARALGSGFSVAFPLVLGMIVGDIVFLSAVLAGLAYVAQSFSMAFTVIKYLGVIYLVYIAFKMWRAGMFSVDIQAERKTGGWSSFATGVLITLGNPKVMLFYVALVPTLIDLRRVGYLGFIELISATSLVLIAVLGGYALLATRARSLLQKPHQLKLLSRVSASFIAGAAMVIAARAS